MNFETCHAADAVAQITQLPSKKMYLFSLLKLKEVNKHI